MEIGLANNRKDDVSVTYVTFNMESNSITDSQLLLTRVQDQRHSWVLAGHVLYLLTGLGPEVGQVPNSANYLGWYFISPCMDLLISGIEQLHSLRAIPGHFGPRAGP